MDSNTNNANNISCAVCEPWNEQSHTPPHRHQPNHWIFPSATTPGGLYKTTIVRQTLDDGNEARPIGTSCTCELGYQPVGNWCWHAAAAFAFELEHDGRHKPMHNPARYAQACEGSLKHQAVILWSQAREAARQRNANRNRLFIRALHRIVEAWNIVLPVGIELRISCETCFGMEFPEMHWHHVDVDPPTPRQEATAPDDSDGDGDDLEDLTEEEIEALAQTMFSPRQREEHAAIEHYSHNGNGYHAHEAGREEW